MAVFKCAEVVDLAPEDEHDGHEVHVIYWYPGSAAISDCPPCVKCGGPMVLIEGEHPKDHPLIETPAEPLHEREDIKAALRKLGQIP